MLFVDNGFMLSQLFNILKHTVGICYFLISTHDFSRGKKYIYIVPDRKPFCYEKMVQKPMNINVHKIKHLFQRNSCFFLMVGLSTNPMLICLSPLAKKITKKGAF